MKTTYYTAMTLDGFLADEHDSLDWLLGQPQDEKGPHNYDEFIAGIGAVVMGATTYEWILAHHEVTGGWVYEQPCWVFTHRDLPKADGDIRFVSGDVTPVHADMTAAADGLGSWIVGGGDLAGQFADAGLLDEMITYIAPATVGAGRPLLPRRYELELLDLARNQGFACARYRVVGPGNWPAPATT